MSTIHAFELLESPATHLGDDGQPAPPLVALFGDDRFLQSLVREAVLQTISPAESEFNTGFFNGESAAWSDVHDQVATVSLFDRGSQRVAVVADADKFVKNFRAELESLADNKSSTAATPGTLVLQVGTWPSNTRLYKALNKTGLQIQCALPTGRGGKGRDTARVCKWICQRGSAVHGVKLQTDHARLILEIAEWNLGRADQELAKLALFGESVDEQMIRDVVGGWRARSIWDAAAAAAQGNASEALEHLASLVQAGEHPVALFGQLAWSLRRYGRLWEHVSRQVRQNQKPDLSGAIAAAGFRQWGGEFAIAEASVRQLTRQRVRHIYQWLRETDLAIKGSHSSDSRARLAIEKLFLRMSAQVKPDAGKQPH